MAILRILFIVLALAVVTITAIPMKMYGANSPIIQNSLQNIDIGAWEESINPPLKLVWTKTPESSIYERRTRPVVADGIAYIGHRWEKYSGWNYVSTEGKLQAISLQNGNIIWSIRGMLVTEPPELSNGRVYACAADGKIYSIDARDGRILWVFSADGTPTAPSIFGHFLYFGTSSGRFYALSAETGEKLWSIERTAVFSRPVATNDAVFIGGSELLSVDPATGRTKWLFSGGWASSAPAVTDTSVFVSCKYRLYCLDIRTGKVKWSYFTGDYYGDMKNPVVSGSTLYWGTVTAFDIDTGKVKWSFDAQNNYKGASVAAANGYVLVGSTHKNEGLDSSDGRLYMLREGTGELAWQYLVGRRHNDWYFIDPSPSISGRSVVLNLSTMQLCCFVAPELSPLQGLSVDKNKINPYDLNNGEVDLTISLRSPSKVTVDVLDYKGDSVRRLVDGKILGAGENRATWHGLIDFPEMADPLLSEKFGDKCVLVAPDGNYRLTVKAEDSNGKVYTGDVNVEVEASI